MAWKVAVASTDGKFINQHFGRAKEFLIFSLEDQGFTFLEKRSINSPCIADVEDHDRVLEETAQALADCQAVLVSQIGSGARMALLSQGVKPYVVTNFIGVALERLNLSLNRLKKFI